MYVTEKRDSGYFCTTALAGNTGVRLYVPWDVSRVPIFVWVARDVATVRQPLQQTPDLFV